MRRSTAITLIALGTGTVVTAVALTDRCRDPQTGQSTACPGTTTVMGRTGGTSGEPQSTTPSTTGHGSAWVGHTIIASSAVSAALAGKSGIGNGPAGSGNSSGGGQSAAAHGGFGAAGAHASSSGS